MHDRFEKHARTVTLLTFVSRVTGLARDAALARIFGVSALMDAFWFAFMVPNLFRRLFGEGALSAAFLPVYSQLDKDNPAVARQLATLTISMMMIALGGLTILGEIILFIISARSDHSNLAVWLMMIMLPYMPMVCTVAILGAMLQVHGRFGPTAAAPMVLNIFIVLAAWGCVSLFVHSSERGEIAHVGLVAASVILAGIVQVAWSLWSLRGRRWWAGGMRRCAAAFEPMKKVLRQAWPMFIGLGFLQINVFMDDLIASYPTTVGPTIFGHPFPLASGSLTAINAAQRLYEFPLGVFGIAVATAIFPALSRAASDKNPSISAAHGLASAAPITVDPISHDQLTRTDPHDSFLDILRRGLRLVIYIGLPASVGLILVRRELTAVVFQGGDFTPADTARVAFVLLGYAPAIWAYSMTHTLTRAFYARGDSMTPVIVALSMVALNLALNLTLIWTPLREAGLAWSTATCAIIQVMILLRLIRKHAPHLVDQTVRTSWLRTAIVGGVMAATVWLAGYIMDRLLPPFFSANPQSWSLALVRLVMMVATGTAVVAFMSRMMRMPEIRWALGRSSSAGGRSGRAER